MFPLMQRKRAVSVVYIIKTKSKVAWTSNFSFVRLPIWSRQMSFLAKGQEHKIYLNLKLYIALTKFLLVFTNMSYFIAQFIKKL